MKAWSLAIVGPSAVNGPRWRMHQLRLARGRLVGALPVSRQWDGRHGQLPPRVFCGGSSAAPPARSQHPRVLPPLPGSEDPVRLGPRLRSGSLVERGPAVALFVAGASFGGIAQDMEAFGRNDPSLAATMARLTGSSGSIVDLYLAYIFAMFGAVVAVHAVQATLRLRSEETAGRAEAPGGRVPGDPAGLAAGHQRGARCRRAGRVPPPRPEPDRLNRAQTGAAPGSAGGWSAPACRPPRPGRLRIPAQSARELPLEGTEGLRAEPRADAAERLDVTQPEVLHERHPGKVPDRIAGGRLGVGGHEHLDRVDERAQRVPCGGLTSPVGEPAHEVRFERRVRQQLAVLGKVRVQQRPQRRHPLDEVADRPRLGGRTTRPGLPMPALTPAPAHHRTLQPASEGGDPAGKPSAGSRRPARGRWPSPPDPGKGAGPWRGSTPFPAKRSSRHPRLSRGKGW